MTYSTSRSNEVRLFKAEGRRQKAEGRSISYGDAYANRLLYLVTEGTAVSPFLPTQRSPCQVEREASAAQAETDLSGN